MIIRIANEKDTAAVLRLLEQVNRVHHDLRPDLFNLATKYTAADLELLFADEDTRVFVCEENGSVLGYVFTVLIDHQDDNMLVPVKELYIDDLCVDEAARGKGVATKLFAYVRQYAREKGCYHITLNVWEGNDSALAFYRKMGMTPQKTKLEIIV